MNQVTITTEVYEKIRQRTANFARAMQLHDQHVLLARSFRCGVLKWDYNSHRMAELGVQLALHHYRSAQRELLAAGVARNSSAWLLALQRLNEILWERREKLSFMYSLKHEVGNASILSQEG